MGWGVRPVGLQCKRQSQSLSSRLWIWDLDLRQDFGLIILYSSYLAGRPLAILCWYAPCLGGHITHRVFWINAQLIFIYNSSGRIQFIWVWEYNTLLEMHFFSYCKEPSKSLCRFIVCVSVCVFKPELWLSLALYPLENVSWICHDVSWMCHECVMNVSWMCHECVINVS